MSVEPRTRKTIQAGQEIDAWCTRCRLDLGHRVVALVAGTPKRVICMTCNSEHNYRAPKTLVTPGVPGRKSERKTADKPASKEAGRAPKGRTSARAEWESQVRSGRPFRRYLATETFGAGDLIQHKKFGEGFVREQSGADKIIVAFSDGDRTLVHGLPA